MVDKPGEMWSKALWSDCINETSGSLMGVISDADMLHMMDDAGKQSEQLVSDVPKDSANVPDVGDDALDLEPPSKLQATCKLDSQAAKTKANREKQRRAQLNNRYTELAALTDPSKKAPKTDRNLILDDAVRVITQLRVENNQLRQLNKLLEERVQEHEAPRGQAVYQSYLMSQGGLHLPARVDGASTSNLMSVPAPPDASAPRDISKQEPTGTAMPGHVASPSTDPSMLAMQMMGVAMQLLQNKTGGAEQPGQTHSAAQQPLAHPQWPQGAIPGVPAHAQHVPQPAPGAMMQYSDAHLRISGDALPAVGNGGDAGSADGAAQPGNSYPQEGTRDAPSSGATDPCIGFKPHALQAHQYMQEYGFPAFPGMVPGWAPGSMMDPALDSKLRPPAA